jgi:hypothetical protein
MITTILMCVFCFAVGFGVCAILSGKFDHSDCESCDALKSCQADCKALEETIDKLRVDLRNSSRTMYNFLNGKANHRILYDLLPYKGHRRSLLGIVER